jgi:hypothetical protein
MRPRELCETIEHDMSFFSFHNGRDTRDCCLVLSHILYIAERELPLTASALRTTLDAFVRALCDLSFGSGDFHIGETARWIMESCVGEDDARFLLHFCGRRYYDEIAAFRESEKEIRGGR